MNICQHLWGGGVKVLFVFLNVVLNLLSKNSKNQHLIFINFWFFSGGGGVKAEKKKFRFFFKC